MRLTVEEHPETIKRYGHIRPGSFWAGTLCAARCPGTARSCTLTKAHRGPHVAHGPFKKVVAVWDREEGRKPAKRPAGRGVKARSQAAVDSAAGQALAALRGLGVRLTASFDEVLMFVFFIGFAVFVLDWFRRLL